MEEADRARSSGAEELAEAHAAVKHQWRQNGGVVGGSTNDITIANGRRVHGSARSVKTARRKESIDHPTSLTFQYKPMLMDVWSRSALSLGCYDADFSDNSFLRIRSAPVSQPDQEETDDFGRVSSTEPATPSAVMRAMDDRKVTLKDDAFRETFRGFILDDVLVRIPSTESYTADMVAELEPPPTVREEDDITAAAQRPTRVSSDFTTVLSRPIRSTLATRRRQSVGVYSLPSTHTDDIEKNFGSNGTSKSGAHSPMSDRRSSDSPPPRSPLPRFGFSSPLGALDDGVLLRRAAHNRVQTSTLSVITWNIAAINNNPFEYWVTHQTPEYLKLMERAQIFIEDADGENDIEVGSIFTDDMFAQLKEELLAFGMTGLDELEALWSNHYSKLPCLSRFLKDRVIGSKRLISMPDRFCNTITTPDGLSEMRPSAISGFEGDLSSVTSWWEQWKNFMFRTEVQVLSGQPKSFVVETLRKIPSAKYPSMSPEEEQISIPLQVLCLAIFDSILINMLNIIAPTTWSQLKSSLSESLNKNKLERLCDILTKTYDQTDVIFIQEASQHFIDLVATSLSHSHHLLYPESMDMARKQNSIALVSKEKFCTFSSSEITTRVVDYLEQKQCVAPGDLLAVSILGPAGKRFVLVSLHGDTNGMTTVPILEAIHQFVQSEMPDHILLMGCDANTTRGKNSMSKSVEEFLEDLKRMGIDSCWDETSVLSAWTTCSARTFIQPQLQKAKPVTGAFSMETTQLKDWILFYKSQLSLEVTARDNTGVGIFEEKVMPTVSFPSDHALVAATLSLH